MTLIATLGGGGVMNKVVQAALEKELRPGGEMARFSMRNLSVLAYANNFTLWHYKAQSVADARQPWIFSDAADMLALGDMIVVSALDGGCVVFVTQSTPGAVIVTGAP